jgi:uncharacterized protein
MKDIVISAAGVTIKVQLSNTPTAMAIWNALPIEGTVNTWGDEIYFDIPVKLPQEPDARADVDVGELGYWPVGQCFCIFFGPTPMSTGTKPRAASPVNVFGRVTGDSRALKSIGDGETITVVRAGT